ncbi:hypothetical protein LXL04_032301 [Taraxacum kok-saghyz]
MGIKDCTFCNVMHNCNLDTPVEVYTEKGLKLVGRLKLEVAKNVDTLPSEKIDDGSGISSYLRVGAVQMLLRKMKTLWPLPRHSSSTQTHVTNAKSGHRYQNPLFFFSGVDTTFDFPLYYMSLLLENLSLSRLTHFGSRVSSLKNL